MHIWKEHMMCMRLDDMHKNEANLTDYVRLYDSLDILNMLHIYCTPFGLLYRKQYIRQHV